MRCASVDENRLKCTFICRFRVDEWQHEFGAELNSVSLCGIPFPVCASTSSRRSQPFTAPRHPLCHTFHAMAHTAIWSVPAAWGLSMAPLIARVILVKTKGRFDHATPRDHISQIAKMPPSLQQLAARLAASHNNQLETLGYYAGAIAVAVAVRVPPHALARLAGMYIKSRIAYNLAYAAPQVANGALRGVSFIASVTTIAIIYGTAATTSLSTY